MKIICFLSCLFTSLALFAQKRTEMTIHFDTDKAGIRPVDSKLLDSLVASFPPKAKNINIEIYGHCDSRGSNGYNDILSVKRVKAVEKYLLAKAVDLSSITNKQGYGEQRPLVDARTIYMHKQNRRVELVITRQQEEITTEEKPGEQIVERSIGKIIDDTATKSGATIILKNLNFIGGSHHLLTSSYKTLQELLNALKKHENLVIQIEGHICCIADTSDGYDYETRTYNLSEERAKAIYTWLVNNQIDRGRLSYKGYGHSNPIYSYPEKTEQERIMNRRVEIKIIKK